MSKQIDYTADILLKEKRHGRKYRNTVVINKRQTFPYNADLILSDQLFSSYKTSIVIKGKLSTQYISSVYIRPANLDSLTTVSAKLTRLNFNIDTNKKSHRVKLIRKSYHTIIDK